MVELVATGKGSRSKGVIFSTTDFKAEILINGGFATLFESVVEEPISEDVEVKDEVIESVVEEPISDSLEIIDLDLGTIYDEPSIKQTAKKGRPKTK